MQFDPSNRLSHFANLNRYSRVVSRNFVHPLGLRKVGGAIALASALIVLPACSNPTPTAEGDGASDYESEIAEDTEMMEEATENTSEYLGEEITVSGDIQSQYGDNAFVLTDEEYFEPDENILVINLDPSSPELTEGEYVQVTGEVNKFVLAQIQEDYDVTLGNDLVKEIETTFVDGPVIVATRVSPVFGEENAQ